MAKKVVTKPKQNSKGEWDVHIKAGVSPLAEILETITRPNQEAAYQAYRLAQKEIGKGI